MSAYDVDGAPDSDADSDHEDYRGRRSKAEEVAAEEVAVRCTTVPRLTHHSRKGLSLPLQLRSVKSAAPLNEEELVSRTAHEPTLLDKLRADADAPYVDVELTIACSELPRLEHTDACMPVFAVLWIMEMGRRGSQWREYGRTEVVQHGVDPQFARSFVLRLHHRAPEDEEADSEDEEDAGADSDSMSASTSMSGMHGRTPPKASFGGAAPRHGATAFREDIRCRVQLLPLV